MLINLLFILNQLLFSVLNLTRIDTCDNKISYGDIEYYSTKDTIFCTMCNNKIAIIKDYSTYRCNETCLGSDICTTEPMDDIFTLNEDIIQGIVYEERFIRLYPGKFWKNNNDFSFNFKKSNLFRSSFLRKRYITIVIDESTNLDDITEYLSGLGSHYYKNIYICDASGLKQISEFKDTIPASPCPYTSLDFLLDNMIIIYTGNRNIVINKKGNSVLFYGIPWNMDKYIIENEEYSKYNIIENDLDGLWDQKLHNFYILTAKKNGVLVFIGVDKKNTILMEESYIRTSEFINNTFYLNESTVITDNETIITSNDSNIFYPVHEEYDMCIGNEFGEYLWYLIPSLATFLLFCILYFLVCIFIYCLLFGIITIIKIFLIKKRKILFIKY